jgi:hypothetical protein
LPLQIASHSGGTGQFKPFFVTRSFVDCAQILGLPKFKLRDSSGNPYLPDKALLQEPLATVHENAGIIFLSEVNKRKAYILSYVKR